MSEQQPNNDDSQNVEGQPLNFLPSAGDTPSSQQPYLLSLQVSGIRQPLSKGPSAGVILSGQHPNSVFLQSFLFFFLHFFGLGVENISDIDDVGYSSVSKQTRN